MKRVIVKRGPVQIACVMICFPIVLVFALTLGIGWVFKQVGFFFGMFEVEVEDDEQTHCSKGEK